MNLKKKQKDTLLTGGLILFGSCLEYYNYMLFMYLIPIWGKQLLGVNDVALKGFSIVFIAALLRPIGATIIGGIGDKFGRKQALFICTAIMSISCIVLSILPSYTQIQWKFKYHILTIAVITCRVLQIASVSGKLNGSAIFLIEHFPKRAGLMSGMIWASTILGMLIAALVESWCYLSNNPNIWRFPIAAGGILSFIGFLGIRYLTEGKEYVESRASTIEALSKKQVFLGKLSVLCIGAAIGGMYYYSFAYIPTVIAKQNNVNIGFYRATMLSLYGLGCLGSGLISDYLAKFKGSLRIYMSIGPIIIIIFSIIEMLHAEYKIHPIVLSLFVGPSHKLMNGLFPANIRYKSISLLYSVGTAIFGGGATVACIYLEKIGKNLPPIFLISTASIGLLGLYASHSMYKKPVTNQ